MLRLMYMRIWLALPAISLALTGCGAFDGPADPGSDAMAGIDRAAVRPAGEGRNEALASGILRADPKSGCLWLEQPDGSVGAQLLLQGEEYQVDFSDDPASVREEGDVVATVGDRVEVGGGYGTDDGVRGCSVSAPTFLGYF